MMGTENQPGLYYSSINELFAKIEERKKLIKYDISLTIVEIYNETVKDLLSKKGIT